MPFKKYPLDNKLPVLDKDIIRAYFSKIGRKGAKTNKKKGKKYWAELSRRGVEARRLKKLEL